MSRKFKLEKRIVVFLDILGFSNTVLNDQENAKKIMNVLDEAVESLKSTKKDHDLDTLKITWFSDSIIISDSDVNIASLLSILLAIENIQSFLCLSQVTIRGGVSIGECYHTGTNVFGEAMVRAYELEKKAITPRVILSEEVMEFIEKSHIEESNIIERKFEENLNLYSSEEMEYISEEYSVTKTNSEYIKMNIIKRDNDGIYYVDYIEELLSRAIATYDSKYNKKYYVDRYEDTVCALRECIENGLKNESKSVKEKYAWIVEKYNQSLRILSKTANKDFLNDFKDKTMQIIKYENVTLIEYNDLN